MIDRQKSHQYQVPRRFGLRTILVVTTLFAAMLSIIRFTDASPAPLIFYSSFIIVVGGAQVVFERSPRLAAHPRQRRHARRGDGRQGRARADTGRASTPDEPPFAVE